MRVTKYALAIFSMLGLMWGKIISVFSASNTLISDEAVELLKDPSTRNEFIEFATGIDNNGKKITVMKFS